MYCHWHPYTDHHKHTVIVTPGWFHATQAMAVIGLVGLCIALLLIGLYMCVHSVSKNSTIIGLVVTCFLSGMWRHYRLLLPAMLLDTNFWLQLFKFDWYKSLCESPSQKLLKHWDLQFRCSFSIICSNFHADCADYLRREGGPSALVVRPDSHRLYLHFHRWRSQLPSTARVRRAHIIGEAVTSPKCKRAVALLYTYIIYSWCLGRLLLVYAAHFFLKNTILSIFMRGYIEFTVNALVQAQCYMYSWCLCLCVLRMYI